MPCVHSKNSLAVESCHVKTVCQSNNCPFSCFMLACEWSHPLIRNFNTTFLKSYILYMSGLVFSSFVTCDQARFYWQAKYFAFLRTLFSQHMNIALLGCPVSYMKFNYFLHVLFFNSVGSPVWIHLNCSYAIIFFG